MNVTIIGSGYVGLVAGTCLAEMGNQVFCVDNNPQKVTSLCMGNLTIFEPDLQVYFERNLREDRLHFMTDLGKAVQHAEIIFLALPTPSSEDGSADLSHVLYVAGEIAQLLTDNPTLGYRVIVNKSTVPVGTAEKVQAVLQDAGLKAGHDFDVVSNPEFLREGVAVADFMKPERVVIGTTSERAADLMKLLYEPFVRQGNPILVMDTRSAEMTKYTANAILATRISFMNEIANVCEQVGANVDEVRLGIGFDSRIGKQFLYPGIGFGGSCFPKDVKALRTTAQQHNYDFQLLQAVLAVNEKQRITLAGRVASYFGGSLEGRLITVWGLAFKPNTDDVREAPALWTIQALLDAGATVTAFDPEAIPTTRAVLGDTITYAENAYDALFGADALVICTEWNEFRRPDFDAVKARMKQYIIFDGRNVFSPQRMAEQGFDYFSIGRPYINPSVYGHHHWKPGQQDVNLYSVSANGNQ